MPIIQHRHVYEALTRRNYFPNQKAPVGELPPSVSTRHFTPEVAELVAAYDEPRNRRVLRYDDVSYLMTRHDNVPRELALIHPRPYARLASKIWTHWDELQPLTNSENSAIKPEQHQDGRMFIMNYEDAEARTTTALEASFGKRFRVETDIAGCFHSIYSHSIPWATVGLEREKARMRDRGDLHWSNELDSLQTAARRGETVGVAIGPGTSSILVELILGRVDENLRRSGFVFRRYIDDYICYCETHEKANEFLTMLGSELAAYRLRLNLQKTTIVELPEPLVEPWVTALGTELKSRVLRADDGSTDLPPTNRASRSLVKFVFGEEDEHEE
ncbi:RNA-directed DNA polymerase, partial [Burkholderia cepacia]|uniref:RNA-directed DNA polymerase n=1 Tax=Burkholderia cepacia TaxID=292 RepID=UPI000AB920CD